MKQLLFTFLLLSTFILTSCRKKDEYPDIKQYDNQEIQNYINANGLSAVMKRDTSDGDTSGMYYQILNEGDNTKPRIEYSDRLAMVYTIRSFDGKYTALDTINNHYNGFLGQFSGLGLPKGLQSGIYNILKYKGGAMRLLIPSRLAYGKSGYGSGSSGNVSGRIAGNQCLDYFVRIVSNQDAYDSIAIQKYMAANSLTGYSRIETGRGRGVHYKISGLDTGDVITQTSKITTTYKLQTFNNNTIQEQTANTTFMIDDLIVGAQEGLKLAKPGQTISLIIPSNLGYGQPASSGGIPAFSCLRFEFNIKSTTSLL